MLFTLTSKFYRQANPTDDNHAAKSLARDVQIRNVRIVAVNARVTLVLWILEFMAIFSVVIFWVFIFGSTSFGTLTNSMVWFHVMIPYTFLMNTSYNKSRIIDDGWKAVIKNSLSNIKNCFSRNKNESNSRTKEHCSSLTSKDEKQNKIHCNKKEIKGSNLEGNEASSVVLNDKIGNRDHSNISIIATFEYDIPSPVIRSLCQIEDLEETPSNSRRFSSHSQKQKLTFNHQIVSLDSDEENDPRVNLGNSSHVKVGEEILSKMAKHLNDEDAYIHYLRQLADYESLLKLQDISQETDFEIAPFIDFKNLKKGKVKCSNENIHNKFPSKNKEPSLKNEHRIDKCDCQLPLNINLSYEYILRAQLRRDMLKHYHKHCDEINRFHDFIDSLIELEENLIEKMKGTMLV